MKLLSLCLFAFLSTAASLSAAEVNNGQTPKVAHTLKLSEDLRFGNDEDDQYFWTGLNTTLSIDTKGRMYVADSKEQRVMVYDQNGKFLKQIGQKGNGPGEFNGLVSYQILADDTAVAMEIIGGGIPKFSWFDAEGKFLRDHRTEKLDKLLQTAWFSPDGKMISGLNVGVDTAAGKMTFTSGVLNKDFEMIKELTHTTKDAFNPSRVQDPDYWAQFLGGNIKAITVGYGMAVFAPDGHVYTAVSNTYEITKWSPDLKQKVLVIKRDYKPVPLKQEDIDADAETRVDELRESLPPQISSIITPAVMKKALVYAELPPIQNPVQGLALMDNGMLMVVHALSTVNHAAVVDLFDQKGVYLGQVTVENDAVKPGAGRGQIKFQNGYAYALERNDDDLAQVVRYKYSLTK